MSPAAPRAPAEFSQRRRPESQAESSSIAPRLEACLRWLVTPSAVPRTVPVPEAAPPLQLQHAKPPLQADVQPPSLFPLRTGYGVAARRPPQQPYRQALSQALQHSPAPHFSKQAAPK